MRNPVAAALADARRRIREDQRGVSDEVGGLLEAIARGLDDPGFEVRSTPLKVLGRFRLEVGVEANAFLDQRRLEVAYHLVCHSELAVAEISDGLGFRSPELFRKWFSARLGEAPDNLRRGAQSARPGREVADRPPCDPAASTDDAWPTEWDWDRLVLGAASSEEAHRLLLTLLVKYPQLADEIPES